MRKLILIFAACLSLALPTLADSVGAQYLTVSVDRVPANVHDAYLSLGDQTWVPLERVSDHHWTGEFLLLSGLYNAQAHPEVHFLDMHGLDTIADGVVGVQIASSTHPLGETPGLLKDGVDVVVSDDIVRGTLAVEDSDGVLHHPQFRGSAFRLPAIDKGEAAILRAQRDDNVKVSYALGVDVDLAELEDSLDD